MPVAMVALLFCGQVQAQKPGSGGNAKSATPNPAASSGGVTEVVLQRRIGSGDTDPVVSGLRVAVKAASPQTANPEGLQFQLEIANFSGQELVLRQFLQPLRFSILNEAGRLQGTPMPVTDQEPGANDGKPAVWLVRASRGATSIPVANIKAQGLTLPPNAKVTLHFAVKYLDNTGSKTSPGTLQEGTYFVCPMIPLHREGQSYVTFTNNMDRGRNLLVKVGT